MATVLLAAGAHAGNGNGPAETFLPEMMVCQGGGMTPTIDNASGSFYVPFTPAAEMANAALPGPGQCAWADRFFGDESTTLAMSGSIANVRLLTEAARVGGTFTVMARPVGDQFILVESIVSVQVVDSSPLSPGPIDATPPPAPGDGGPLTASTCGLPGGTATVVIADPSLTTLNVRDKPIGKIIGKIPEGAEVTVAGGCGVEIAAGIVAQKGGGEPPIPGWCAITAPKIGCVSEQFLVAGGLAGAATSAGIVAPRPPAAPDFTGAWNGNAQGAGYVMTFSQDGDNVSGSYTADDGSSGQLKGSVTGNMLRFTWWQADGLSGAGRFALSDDGDSFTGSFTLGTDPEVADGSWNGTRR